jgi:hypothetical protein
MSNPTHHTCATCGHTWLHGQHGGHSCATLMAVTIAEKDQEIERLSKLVTSADGVAQLLADARQAMAVHWKPKSINALHIRARMIDRLDAALSGTPSAQRWTLISEGLPAAPLFDSLEVIVAVQRAHNGKVYVFTTDYLNRYPIIRMDQTVQDDDNASDEITGWYYLSDDEETWHRTLADGDQVIAWQLKPAAPEVPEQVQP